MFFAGSGSGFEIQTNYGETFKLSTLYPTCRKEREGLSPVECLRKSRLFQSPDQHTLDSSETSGSSGISRDIEMYTVTPNIRQLCGAMNGFVFVVDSSRTEEGVYKELYRLSAVFCGHWQ